MQSATKASPKRQRPEDTKEIKPHRTRISTHSSIETPVPTTACSPIFDRARVDVRRVQPIIDGCVSVEDGSFQGRQSWLCQWMSEQRFGTHLRSTRNDPANDCAAGGTRVRRRRLPGQQRMFDQICGDCTSGKISTGFQKGSAPWPKSA